MYFTDCKIIDQTMEIDVQKFRGYKAIGFLSITSVEWQSAAGADRLRFLEQFLVSKDECFFYVSTSIDIRAEFISIMQQCSLDFKVEDCRDFIAYYRVEDIKFGKTDIRLTLLPSTIDETLTEIEEVIDGLKFGLIINNIKVAIIKKTPIFLFELLKRLAGG